MDEKPKAAQRRLFAVFGKPVLHSKSPQLFSHLLRGGDKYLRIRPQTISDLILTIKLLSIEGASITSPFKEEIIPYLDELSEAASTSEAVNCIRQEEGIIIGHNTDALGVIGAFAEAGINLRNARVLVLGAGGAAKAAVYGLTKIGAKVYISNRTQEKAKALEKKFGTAYIPWESPGRMPHFDAIVSTLLPDAIPPYAEQLSFDYLLDAVYKPSKMSYHSIKCGKKVIPGERWLIHQGIAAADFYILQNNKMAKQLLPYQPQQTINKSAKPEDNDPRVQLMENKLNEPVNMDNLRVLALNEHTNSGYDPEMYDLIVSCFGLNEQEINLIIDEEKRLAIGH